MHSFFMNENDSNCRQNSLKNDRFYPIHTEQMYLQIHWMNGSAIILEIDPCVFDNNFEDASLECW